MTLYLDYNATHPLLTDQLILAIEDIRELPANPSGVSAAAKKARKLLEDSRDQIAGLLRVDTRKIAFTASATEALNMVLFSAARAGKKIFYSEYEHPAVRIPAQKLHGEPFTLSPDPDGLLIEELALRIRNPDTLHAIMAVQNETGQAFPVPELIELIEQPAGIVLCDAVQAVFRFDTWQKRPWLNISDLNVGLSANFNFVLSGHKIGAGQGCAILLYSAQSEEILRNNPLLSGGSQEYEIRPGTHNLLAIRSFTRVLKLILEQETRIDELISTTQKLESTLLGSLTNVSILGDNRVPGTTLLFLPGRPIDFILMGLDQAGITCSTGTSCKSGSRTPSPALLASGIPEHDAMSVLRFSYGKMDDQTISDVCQRITKVIRKF